MRIAFKGKQWTGVRSERRERDREGGREACLRLQVQLKLNIGIRCLRRRKGAGVWPPISGYNRDFCTFMSRTHVAHPQTKSSFKVLTSTQSRIESSSEASLTHACSAHLRETRGCSSQAERESREEWRQKGKSGRRSGWRAQVEARDAGRRKEGGSSGSRRSLLASLAADGESITFVPQVRR